MQVIILLLVLLFLLGLAVGSFINVLEMRLYKEIDFVKSRSFCPKCKHVLSPIDLVPILSFILLKGRCRYCGTKVSWQYPIIEFLSGLLFLASGCYVIDRMRIQGVGDMLFVICIAIFISFILVLFLFFALYDVKHQIVPDKVIKPAIIICLFIDVVFAVFMQLGIVNPIFDLFTDFSLLWNIVSCLFGGSFIALIIILTKGKGMGGGDLKLVVLMGLILGWKKLIIAFYLSVIIGSLVGIAWGIYKGKIKGLKVPFGLFLAIGTIIAFLFGDGIIDSYLMISSFY